MVAIGVNALYAGKGLDTYRTHWLVQESWIGFLIFVVAATLALLVSLWFRWREHREWRELEQKYGQSHHDA